MKLDFLIPASPNASFFSQIAFFRLCLNHLGGDYAAARVVASFGGQEMDTIPDNWRIFFDKIDVEWAGHIRPDKPGFHAQHDRRFEVFRRNADLIVLCDADIAILRPFDELVSQITTRPALAGTIAHYPFPKGTTSYLDDSAWTELARAIIGKDIQQQYRYSLLPNDAAPIAPFYINYGVFAGPPDLMEEFYCRDIEIRQKLLPQVGIFWSSQISLALTCADLNLPTFTLPLRYNFPNDPVADKLYPDEMSQIVFLHYLRTEQFQRDKIFASQEHFDAFITGDFIGSNGIFRDHVAKITGGKYPFS